MCRGCCKISATTWRSVRVERRSDAHGPPDGFKEDEALSVHSLDWEHPVGLPFEANVIIAADVVRPNRYMR